MINYRYILLITFLGLVFVQTLSFAEYMRRLGKRLKHRSKKLYKEVMPGGWLRAAVGRGSLVRGYGAAKQLQNSADTTLQQEGHNLKMVYNFLLVIEILTIALLIKAVL